MNTGLHMNFLEEESGAVTIDWVVLTAAIVLLAAGIALVVAPAVQNLSSDIGDKLHEHAEQM